MNVVRELNADDPVALCLRGRIAPEIALARLLLAGEAAAGIAARIAAARVPGDAWAGLARLASARGTTLDELRAMIDAADFEHAGVTTPESVAFLFDRAVALSPEASVALYSLGDPAILAAATAELLAWLEGERLLTPGMDVLDFGCGIGRVAAALATQARSVMGVDVSPAMIAVARSRCAGQANVSFVASSGHGLEMAADQSHDLVLAVDSFPYLMQASVELAGRHVAEAARVLRPGGALVVLNLSYRRDAEADDALAAAWAARHGWLLQQSGVRPFSLWDGNAFVWRRQL